MIDILQVKLTTSILAAATSARVQVANVGENIRFANGGNVPVHVAMGGVGVTATALDLMVLPYSDEVIEVPADYGGYVAVFTEAGTARFGISMVNIKRG